MLVDGRGRLGCARHPQRGSDPPERGVATCDRGQERNRFVAAVRPFATSRNCQRFSVSALVIQRSYENGIDPGGDSLVVKRVGCREGAAQQDFRFSQAGVLDPCFGETSRGPKRGGTRAGSLSRIIKERRCFGGPATGEGQLTRGDQAFRRRFIVPATGQDAGS